MILRRINHLINLRHQLIIIGLPSGHLSSNAMDTKMICDIRYIRTKAALTNQNTMKKIMPDKVPPIFKNAASPTAVPIAQ